MLFAFHIVLMPLKIVWIQVFSLSQEKVVQNVFFNLTKPTGEENS